MSVARWPNGAPPAGGSWTTMPTVIDRFSPDAWFTVTLWAPAPVGYKLSEANSPRLPMLSFGYAL